jgi:hypothetical protein
MRALGLRVLYALGTLTALFPLFPLFVFAVAWKTRKRAFHPNGTVCEAVVTAKDGVVGPRIAGPAIVRLSTVSGDENAIDISIMGLAFAFADGTQNLALATFEAFTKMAAAKAAMTMTDYFANEFSSVTPWRTDGHGVVWYRAIPLAPGGATGTRVERLDAAIAAGTAGFSLELRTGPAKGDAVIGVVAEVKLTKRLPEPEAGKHFRVKMRHTKRGIFPTGFRNGIRVVAYPTSQLGRRVRGG